MADYYRSLKRRNVLSAIGVGILGSVASAPGVATKTSNVSSDSEEKIVNPIQEPIEGFVAATHTGTGNEYIFESSGEIDTKNLPAGEYRLEHYEQRNRSVAVHTEHITLDDSIETTSSEATLDTKIDDDRGIDAEGNLPVWVSTTTDSDENVSSVPNATIELEVTNDNNEVVIEDSTTTDESGSAFIELGLDLEEGDYSLDIEWIEEELSSFHSFKIGSIVEVGRLSGPVGTNEQAGIPVSRTLENDPNPGTTEVELERPDGSTETLSADINEGGVGIAEFVPNETGSHRVNPPDGWGRTVNVQNLRFYTESFRLRDQLVNEPVVYGGFILDDNVTPVGDESITVEIQERHGGNEVYDSVETSTDANGRFTVEFDPLSEADRYSVVVQTTDGKEIGSERVRLHETEEEDEPELSVSFDKWNTIPGEEVMATIDLTDAADEPVEGDVTVIERIGFRGPILAIDSVSTNEEGTAEYETNAPDTFIENERFYVEGIVNINGKTLNNNDSVSVESVDVDFSWSNVEAGGSAEREITITDRTTDEPISGVDTGMVFARGHDARGGAIEADNGTTDSDGTVEFEFAAPDDARQRVQFHALYLPYRPLSWSRSGYIRPFSSSVEIPNEVSPGESFEMAYTVDDHDAETVGMFFIDKSNEAHVEVIEPNEPVSVDVPAHMAGDRVRTYTVIIDTDAHITRDYNSVSVSDEEVDSELTATFDFEPQTPNVDKEVSFDASDSTATGTSIDSYQWDFTDNEVIDAEGEEVSYTFEEAGNIDVTLTVTGEDETTDSTTQTVTVIGEGTHESGVDQDVFDAVDQSGDGDLSLGELQDAVEDWGADQQIDGVEASLEDLRAIVDWWAS